MTQFAKRRLRSLCCLRGVEVRFVALGTPYELATFRNPARSVSASEKKMRKVSAIGQITVRPPTILCRLREIGRKLDSVTLALMEKRKERCPISIPFWPKDWPTTDLQRSQAIVAPITILPEIKMVKYFNFTITITAREQKPESVVRIKGHRVRFWAEYYPHYAGTPLALNFGSI